MASTSITAGATPKPASPATGPRTRAYLFSELERPYYRREFGREVHSTSVIGIPRHDPRWVERIVAESEHAAATLGSGFVTLISRPGGSPYFPLERKRQALEDIRRVIIEQHKLMLVVKLHPKERQEGLFEEVLGRAQYGHGWVYSSLHPFALAGRSSFAVTFYSGVAVDMIALRTPVIERLDLRGLAECDTAASLRDPSGEPVFSYRYLGLVLGASDATALDEWVTRLQTERNVLLEALTARYRALFPDGADSAEIVAREIGACVGSR